MVTSSSASLVAVTGTYVWYGQEAAVVVLSRRLSDEVRQKVQTTRANPSICAMVYVKVVVVCCRPKACTDSLQWRIQALLLL